MPTYAGKLSATLTPVGTMSAVLNGVGNLSAQLSVGNAQTVYGGEYTVTPTSEAQILRTKDKLMTADVTINPIPNNYGLITWNGSTLTVS